MRPLMAGLLAALACAWTASSQAQAVVLNPDLAGLQGLPGGGLLAWGSDASIWRRDAGNAAWLPASTPHSARVHAVAQADGALVAVGEAGLLMRSKDGGRVWEASPTSQGQALMAVACRRSDCLAVGPEGLLLRSSDAGSNWQQLHITQGPTGPLSAVTTAGTQGWWVATAQGQVWHTAGDGQPWSAQALPAGLALDAMADDQSGVLAATADGVLRSKARPDAPWRSVYRKAGASYTQLVRLPQPDAWVALGSRGTCAWREKALAAWRSCHTAPQRLLRGLASDPAGRHWVVVGEGGLLLSSSDQGRSWRAAEIAGLDEPRHLEAVAWSGPAGGFTAVGHGGLVLRSDAHGRLWSIENQTPQHYVHDLVQAANGDLVASLSHRTLARSNDQGRHWVSRRFSALKEPAYLFALHADKRRGSLVVAGGQGSVMVAPDGRNWRMESTGHGVDYLGLLAQPETALVLLYGSGGTVLRVDSEHAEWQRRPLPSDDPVYGGVATPGGGMVLLGGKGLALSSSDGGLSWRQDRLGQTTLQVGMVMPDGSNLLVAGDRGTLYRAPLDKQGLPGDWQRLQAPAADWRVLQADAAGKALWLAGGDGQFARSEDGGVQWELVAMPTRSALRRPVYDAARQRWWMPGRDGTLLRSDDDGRSWQRVATQTTEHLKGVWVNPETGALVLYGARLITLNPENGS